MNLKQKTIAIYLVTLLALAVLLTLSVMHWAKQSLVQHLQIEAETEFDVVAGDSVGRVLSRLDRNGVIRHDIWSRLQVRVFADYSVIKQGTYELEPGDTLLQLLDKISQGKVKQFSITLVEGHAWKMLRQQILAHPAIVDDLEDEAIISELQLEGESLEGWLLPDTYLLTKPTQASTFVKRAIQAMRSALQQEWQDRQGLLPLDSPYEALILASIIEKETGLASERPHIASVFINRLNLGMRLQTDPTVIYGLGDRFDGDIKRVHLREATPYNTYVINGLPPTPIAMPGAKAIAAALNPIDTEDLFFVSRGDGSHVFSQTLQQHNRAVRKYQLKLDD